MLAVTDTDQAVTKIDDTAVDVDTAHPPNDPWRDPAIFGQSLAEHIPYDTGALAILSDEQPQVDELLVADGFTQVGLSRWLRNEFDRDGMVASARQNELAVSKARAAGQRPACEAVREFASGHAIDRHAKPTFVVPAGRAQGACIYCL